MEILGESLSQAWGLILHFDPYLGQVVGLSLAVSGLALVVSTALGVPLGSFLGLYHFPGRRLSIALIYTGMGFPPIVVGLFVYLLLSRAGPLTFLSWLFTPQAMVIAQVLIASPLVTGFTMAAVKGVSPRLHDQLVSLGATRWQATWAILKEARLGVLVAIVAGLGGIISEVGAVMLVGGNIEGSTRVLTTAILLETRRGAFDVALALGLILLALTFLINVALLRLQGRTLD
ncbi:MAG: ABC transporter permease [Chloroflexota bacterium]